LRISRILALSGPNVWSRNPVLEVWLRGEPAEALSSRICPGFREGLADWWSAACAAAGATADERRQYGERLRGAEEKTDVFRLLTLGLQMLAGTPIEQGSVVSECDSHTAHIAAEFEQEAVGRMAVKLAHEILWPALPVVPTPADVVSKLRTRAAECCFGTTTRAVVAAARARGIPVSRVDDDSLLRLGHGAKQRLIQGAITSRAGFLAESVSRDKLLTKRLLRRLRLPTAEGRLVPSAEEAWVVACEIGLPVVVKPRNADYGNGVSLDLMTRAEIAAAWERAREFRPDVLVERQLAGVPHRLFVVNDRVVAAARREPAHVVGDGRLTVGALIDCANRDPRRGEGADRPLYPIGVDPQLVTALAKQSLNLDSVPAAGRVVNLQLDPSECRAETILDVTDGVHPDVSAAAIDAVRAVGLDVAGVDVVAVDIGRPLEEQGGGILEVNAGPAIYLHRSPQCQPGRPVAEAIVESLFPHGDTGRIPLIAVVGQKRAADVARAIPAVVADGTHVVGASGSDGITIGKRRLTAAPSADASGCQTLLAHPRVDLAVCELSPESVRNEGLPFDECTVAVLAGFDGPATGSTLARERLRVLRLVIESARGPVVANVEDVDIAAAFIPGQPGLIAVALDGNQPFLIAHCRRGGIAVFSDGPGIVPGKCDGAVSPMLTMRRGRIVDDGSSTGTIDAVLAHAAASALNGINFEPIRDGSACNGKPAIARQP
jgi:cyanophycin synthetase